MERCYKTFVSIGNGKQYFTRMLDAVEQCAELLPQPVLIQRGHTPFTSQKCMVVDFVSMDEFIQRVAQAEMLIMHAGAGSVMHSINAGKRPILMPRSARFDEIVNEHQIGFAKILYDAGKAYMVENQDQLAHMIEKAKQDGIKLTSAASENAAMKIINDRLKLILGETTAR